MNHRQILENLLSCQPSLTESVIAAHGLPWDSKKSLVILNPTQLISVLTNFIAGKVSSSQVEDWANAIEAREDIGYEPGSEVGLALHNLANPLLEGQLSLDVASEWVGRLSAAQPNKSSQPTR
jgi:hypothetical protein